MEYYSAIKNNEILPFVIIWIAIKTIMLNEITQRKTNIITSFICEMLKSQILRSREHSGYQEQEDRENREMLAKGYRAVVI